MKCAHCKHFDIEQHAGHLKVGFGLCRGFPKLRGLFVGITHDSNCLTFLPAPESEIKKRRKIWKAK